MDLARYQDTRSTYRDWLHFFILTVKYQEGHVNKQYLLKIYSRRQNLRNRPSILFLTKEVKTIYSENYETLIKETRGNSKEMEKYPMLLVWNN